MKVTPNIIMQMEKEMLWDGLFGYEESVWRRLNVILKPLESLGSLI